MIQRALLSVFDKQGIVELGQTLTELGAELVSTGGTAALLKENHIAVTPVELVTGFPEMLGGRVKTLHPHIHGALLARRDKPEDTQDLQQQGIATLDLVAVNLYPFKATVAQHDTAIDEAIEQIDIGGVALLRAAAKNYRYVTVLSDPADYGQVITQLRTDGDVSVDLRKRLAVKAFQQTARYDAFISEWLARNLVDADAREFPGVLSMRATKAGDLRYGENPHQRGALYRLPNGGGLAHAEQLHGKGMSYTNWLDAEGAWQAVQQFTEPAAVVVKHTSPCGIATHSTLETAYRHALESDSVSAFGGVVAVNRSLDVDTAAAIDEIFTEIILAPDFAPDALELLVQKRNRRLLRVPPLTVPGSEIRAIPGGFIAQTRDHAEATIDMQTVTERRPSEAEREALAFAWRAIVQVKSNAIALAQSIDGGFATVGIGTGQPSRIDAIRQAIEKAGDAAKAAVLASDAFFPFPDSVEAASDAGITAIIQPGGSIRDDESIAAANAAGMAMVFTGVRHFKH